MTRSLIVLVFALAILCCATGSTAQTTTKWEGGQAEHLIEVALLTDDDFVDTPEFEDYRGEGGPYWASPSFFFAIILSQRGHNMTFLSHLGEHYGSVEDEVIEVLSTTPVLVVPTLDLEGPPPQDLPEVFTQYLNNGGVVVWTGELEALSWLLSLNITAFEANIAKRQLTEEVFEKTEAAQGTPFANGPAFVEDWESGQVANMTTGWPEEAVCLYAAEQGGEELCAVFFMPVGEGVVVYLGWSYYAYDWPAYGPPVADGKVEAKTGEVEERDVMTKQWKEVFVLAVEGFVEPPSSSSSDHSQDSNSESSQDSQNEDSFAGRLTPFGGSRLEGEELCAVFFMPVGEGVVVCLGWSYYAGEVEERDMMTKQWKEVFLLVVEGFVEPSSSSSDRNSESSQDSQSEDSFAERLTPFIF